MVMLVVAGKMKSPQTECSHHITSHCTHTHTLHLQTRSGWRWGGGGGEKRAETRNLLMCCVLKPLLALISHQANANEEVRMAKTHTSTQREGARILKKQSQTQREGHRSRWKRGGDVAVPPPLSLYTERTKRV